MIFSASKRTQKGEEVKWEGAVERIGWSRSLKFSHVPSSSPPPPAEWGAVQVPEHSAAKPPGFSAGTRPWTPPCLRTGQGRAGAGGSTTAEGVEVLEVGCTPRQPLFTFLLLPCARAELGRRMCGLWLVVSSLGLLMAPCLARAFHRVVLK